MNTEYVNKNIEGNLLYELEEIESFTSACDLETYASTFSGYCGEFFTVICC